MIFFFSVCFLILQFLSQCIALGAFASLNGVHRLHAVDTAPAHLAALADVLAAELAAAQPYIHRQQQHGDDQNSQNDECQFEHIVCKGSTLNVNYELRITFSPYIYVFLTAHFPRLA